ncbi:MAG: YggS family pyridoxal phosphate-dependent enzyme [Bdellovibrionales bacterium]|nr:YggS family pyridoxal phosphate-dependent enzyme [Bdellovibrionales bacterium]
MGSSDLSSDYQTVRSKVPAGVTLVAVSKTKPVEMIQQLYRLGHRDFGENYVQELCEKAKWCRDQGLDQIRWHMIGHLQSNKVKALVEYVSVVHTVDRLEIAQALAKRWKEAGRSGKLPVFLEVNIDGENSKAGILPEKVGDLGLAVRGLSDLQLRGLMVIPAPGSKDAFQKTVLLNQGLPGGPLPEISMGMSDDFEAAIRAGSTCVRVGSAIFGKRI